MIDKKLLSMLACPDCKGDLEYKNKMLMCKKCQERFDIKEGIPVLMPKKK